jgi:hypothetical protein
MANRTRSFPRDLSNPEPLQDHQVAGLGKILAGFRHLYELLDDVLPTGEAKDAVIASLVSVKRASDDVVRHHRPRLTFKRLAELYAPIENMDRRVVKVVVNAYTFAEMRSDPSIYPHWDPETSRDRLRTGLIGTILGASLYISRAVPINHAVIIAEDEDVEIGPDWAPSPVQLEKI